MVDTAAIAAINLRLNLLGLRVPEAVDHSEGSDLVRPILARQRELDRRVSPPRPSAVG